MESDKIKSEELAVFWAQHQPAIAGFVCSLVPNFQDADDILQNVAVITVEKFDEYDRSKPFVGWAIGIARNLILKYYSDKKKDRITLDSKAIENISRVYEAEMQTFSSHKTMVENAMERCLEQLKGRWRILVEMYYLREFSTARIAQQLGMTPGNVLTSLHRVRAALRDCVANRIKREA